jgi:hypothetical protein
MWRLGTKPLKNDRGASLVEMTLVTPLLISLAFGFIEFGTAFYQYQLMTTGIKDAARYLARVDDPIAEQAKGKELAVYGAIGGTTKRVPWWDVSVVDVTLNDPPTPNPVDPTTGLRPYRGGDTIDVVRVETDVEYQDLGLLSALNIPRPRFLIFQEERVIGE